MSQQLARRNNNSRHMITVSPTGRLTEYLANQAMNFAAQKTGEMVRDLAEKAKTPGPGFRGQKRDTTSLKMVNSSSAKMQERMLSAPAAMGSTGIYKPSLQPTTVTREIPVGDLHHVGNSGHSSLSTLGSSGPNRLFLNPGNTACFRWAGRLAALFQEGRITGCKVLYRPMVGSNTDGRVIIAYVEKTNDRPCTTSDELTQYRHLAMSVWAPGEMALPLPTRYVPCVDANSNSYSPLGGGVFDPLEHFLGLLQFWDNAAVSTDHPLGRIALQFTMTLRRPRPDVGDSVGEWCRISSASGDCDQTNGPWGASGSVWPEGSRQGNLGTPTITRISTTEADLTLREGYYEINLSWAKQSGTTVPTQGGNMTYSVREGELTTFSPLVGLGYGSVDVAVMSSGTNYDAMLSFLIHVKAVSQNTGRCVVRLTLPAVFGGAGTWTGFMRATRIPYTSD